MRESKSKWSHYRVIFTYNDGTSWKDAPRDLAVLMVNRGEGRITR